MFVMQQPTRACLAAILVLTIGLAPALWTQSSAEAGIVAQDLIRLKNDDGHPGGMFGVDDLNDGPLGSFEFNTFCVDLYDHVSFNSSGLSPQYYVKTIGNTTNPGASNPLHTRTLGPQAAWLFKMFATQNSSVFGMGFDFANPGADAANALQLGIWQGMGYSASEIYSLAGWTTTKQNTLISMYLGAPGGSTGWLTTFVPTAPMVLGVQIMNLHTFQFDSSGSEVLPPPDGRRIKITGRAQDQLIYTPQEVIVPELPSFLTGLTSIAVAGLCSVLAQMRRLRQPAGDVAA